MRALYVETTIRCELAELWRLTEDPSCHERWDLRFTRITYLPPDAGRSRFSYSTTILPGLTIGGVGVTWGSGGGRTGHARRRCVSGPAIRCR